MKTFINRPEKVVEEMLQGLAVLDLQSTLRKLITIRAMVMRSFFLHAVCVTI